VRKKIETLLTAVATPTLESAPKIFSLLDLTTLNDTDTPAIIATLCGKATALNVPVAAVCVYPQFVAQVSQLLSGTAVRIATVANFPRGDSSLTEVTTQIREAIAAGAHEIDVVFPYTTYLEGDKLGAQDFIRHCKTACGANVVLKVILETGAFNDLQILAEACQDVMLAGADFLKTSTGKFAIGATLEAAAVMLLTIKEITPNLNRRVGFKAAGGVKTIATASQYIALAQHILGEHHVTANTFRLGASQLCDVILEQYDNA
jgi:deoxyribose-phosphate aldolase